MGGIGKTQLALEYAYQHGSEFNLVWWLRAEEPATLLEDYARLAAPLGLAQAGESEIAAVAAAVCQELARRESWLLVFDNANAPGEIEQLLPRGGGGRVLITSRNPHWPFAAELDVPTLSRDAAVKFLLERTGQRDERAADALAEELGDLPLALEQAAAYIVETGSALADYLTFFRKRRRELWSEEKPPSGYPATVGTTWTMAVDRLRTEEPRAVDLLHLCAFLAPEAIPRRLLTEHHAALPCELAAAAADPLRLNRLTGALRRYSLVEVTGEALSFHRLIQAAARDALEPDGRRSWAEAAVALMIGGFPHRRNEPSTWEPARPLLAHVLAAASYADDTRDIEGARLLLSAAAGYLERRDELHQAQRILELATELAEEALGAEHPEVAKFLNKLGGVLRRRGDLPNATAAVQRALAIDEASFGPDHPSVASDVNNLGLILRDLGDLAGAKAACERALKIREATVGPGHPDMARPLNNLGLVLLDLGDTTGAKAAFKRALAIDEANSGPPDPEAAMHVNNLGLVLWYTGDLADARAAFERAMAINEATFGNVHSNVAVCANNLGGVLRELGDLAGATAAFERALTIFGRVLGPHHPNTRIARGNLESLGGR